MARKPPKGKRVARPYKQLPNEVIQSEQFKKLSGNAMKVLMHLLAQYRGSNNGDLSAPKSAAADYGLSVNTWEKAKRELLQARCIEISRVGETRKCHLYALTFFAIDECGSKLDISATHTYSDDWKTAG